MSKVGLDEAVENEDLEALLGGQDKPIDEPIDEPIVDDFEYSNEDSGELDLTAAQQKAWTDGWRPEDMFQGKAGNWKNAESYILYGEMQGQLREVKEDSRRQSAAHEESIANLNKLHAAQQEHVLAELIKEQREAVELSDTEKYDQIQQQIDDHQPVIEPAAPAKDPYITEWDAANPWINDANSEKAAEAKALFGLAASKEGATAKSALDYVDAQLAKLYPPAEIPTNQRREMPTMSEQSTKTNQRRRNKELTMNDLTASELNEWESFGQEMFKTEKAYLKAVTDSRKEQ